MTLELCLRFIRSMRTQKATDKQVERNGKERVIENGQTYAMRPVGDIGLRREDKKQSFRQQGSQCDQQQRYQGVIAEDAVFQPAYSKTDQGAGDDQAAKPAMRRRGEARQNQPCEEPECR